jgi:hypothetical protein
VLSVEDGRLLFGEDFDIEEAFSQMDIDEDGMVKWTMIMHSFIVAVNTYS